MSNKATPVEILKLLDNSNCGECGEKTCMAFAAAVFKGQRRLADCPKLDPETIDRFQGQAQPEPQADKENGEDIIKELKKAVAGIDLEEAARRTGGRVANNRLTIKILGKNFSVDTEGNLFSEIHINHWVAGPFLDYVLHTKGRAVTGKWLSFRELKEEGRERYPLFQKRCEEPIKRVADAYPDLFKDMVETFGGTRVDESYEADIAVVMYPLPRVPIMICYWLPEEGMASSLTFFSMKAPIKTFPSGPSFRWARAWPRCSSSWPCGTVYG